MQAIAKEIGVGTGTVQRIKARWPKNSVRHPSEQTVDSLVEPIEVASF
jgi:hypothetical protein